MSFNRNKTVYCNIICSSRVELLMEQMVPLIELIRYTVILYARPG